MQNITSPAFTVILVLIVLCAADVIPTRGSQQWYFHKTSLLISFRNGSTSQPAFCREFKRGFCPRGNQCKLSIILVHIHSSVYCVAFSESISPFTLLCAMQRVFQIIILFSMEALNTIIFNCNAYKLLQRRVNEVKEEYDEYIHL